MIKTKPNEKLVSKELTKSHALPARLYLDPAVYEKEKELIFSKTWQYAGHVGQLQKHGDYFTTTVAGTTERIVVLLDKDLKIRAYYNVCPHRGARLMEGSGNKKVMQCPYHAWTFKLDGSLHRTPGFEGIEEFDPDDYCLTSVNVDVAGPFIFVNLDENAEPITNTVGALFDDVAHLDLKSLKKVKTVKFKMKTNWKIVVDNFLECYHCPVSHPSFADLIDLENYHTKTFDYYSYQSGPPKDNADLEREKYGISDNIDEEEIKEGRYNFLWPNFMFNFYPGETSMSTNWIVPIDHEHTEAVYEFFFKDDNLNKEQEELINLITQVQQEDVEICEYVYEGFQSKSYTQGRYALKENGVHHFHLLIQDALGLTESK